MRKTFFKNTNFYYLLIGYLAILLLYNIIFTIKQSTVLGLLPIAIQTALLVFIITQNKYAKVLIQVWATAVLIVVSVIDLTADAMDVLNDGFQKLSVNSVIYDVIQLAIGILIIDYLKRTVVVGFVDSMPQAAKDQVL